ncbi:GFA family protein [Brevundimonas lenta]|uniref:CENP-V/GFA domain-containing protein n=1 Tax=Brevundimonas lenta TaxID=424796 RepID=A0A7W6JFU8_9CAUL|nr:GFA family protein [Brevundimonas lenta]MBB4084389.1 hypothetical protein [Brevundimonas lenta]
MTEVREARCRCGQLSAACLGEPVRVSVCHCLACQQRSGSAFAAQARYPADRVTITGEHRTWTRVADSGREVDYGFCPNCGSTVFYTGGNFENFMAIPVGAFADPAFPPPHFSVWERRKHAWTEVLGDEVDHSS